MNLWYHNFFRMKYCLIQKRILLYKAIITDFKVVSQREPSLDCSKDNLLGNCIQFLLKIRLEEIDNIF